MNNINIAANKDSCVNFDVAKNKIRFKFSKKKRINSSDIFLALLKQRPSLKNEIFSLHIIKNKNINTRLGLIISKKLCKKANNRNKIKRIIREAFRLNTSSINGLDILCRLKYNTNKNNLKNVDFKIYADSIDELFKTVIKHQNKY